MTDDPSSLQPQIRRSAAPDVEAPTGPAADRLSLAGDVAASKWDDGDGINEPGEDDVLDRYDDPRFIRWIDRKMAPVRRHPVAGPAWKLVILVLGVTLALGGLIMVFVPGPGWATVLLGVAVLATEFVWARRMLRFGNHHVSRWSRWVKRQPAWFRYTVGGIATIGLVSIVLSLLYFIGGIDVPEKLGLPGFRRCLTWLGLRPKRPFP